jgi:hypothetical protein
MNHCSCDVGFKGFCGGVVCGGRELSGAGNGIGCCQVFVELGDVLLDLPGASGLDVT